MTRMARGRDTHLEPAEIAAETLRQFDAGAGDPSIRQLARSLGVAPSAIYHHFDARADIIAAALDLVWQEIALELVQVIPDPYDEDPVEVLVVSGLATRRAFVRHYRIAQFMAATPQADDVRANTLALTANVLERMGIAGDEAAIPFHSYASYTLGASLFAATRRMANEQLARDAEEDAPAAGRFRSLPHPSLAARSREDTRAALDDMMDLSSVDPDRDEELFELGLRRLIATFDPRQQAGSGGAGV